MTFFMSASLNYGEKLKKSNLKCYTNVTLLDGNQFIYKEKSDM